jgi:hypothetical protein
MFQRKFLDRSFVPLQQIGLAYMLRHAAFSPK